MSDKMHGSIPLSTKNYLDGLRERTMPKKIELKVVMDGIPNDADVGQIVREIQEMVSKEYADGVYVNVSDSTIQSFTRPLMK